MIDIILSTISSKKDKFELSHFGESIINKRIMIFFGNNPLGLPDQEFLYDFTFDFPFRNQNFICDGIPKHVNTRFILKKQDSISEQRTECYYYTNLSLNQRCKIKFYFKKHWFQSSSNLMWIINLLVALLAILASIEKCS